MAQGEFTKEEADHANKCLSSLFDGIPKSKRGNFLGELNDLGLFLEAANRAAPETVEDEKKEN
jgi:hypothetical protein